MDDTPRIREIAALVAFPWTAPVLVAGPWAAPDDLFEISAPAVTRRHSGPLRERSTYKNRSPRVIHQCAQCNGRLFGLAKPLVEKDPNTKKSRVIATHKCSGTANHYATL